MKLIFRHIKKLWLDTLTNKHGKYSRKSIMIFISFNFCLISGLIDMLSNFEIKEFIFFGFLGMAGGQTALSVIDKYKKDEHSNYNITTNQDQDPTTNYE